MTFKDPPNTPPIEIPAAQRPNLTITFGTDGTFTAKADCNQVTGGYTTPAPGASSGDLTIVPGPATGAVCASSPLPEIYVLGLSRAKSYAIDPTTKLLTITMTDGGTLVFEVNKPTP
jgi:hypothetical protein